MSDLAPLSLFHSEHPWTRTLSEALSLSPQERGRPWAEVMNAYSDYINTVGYVDLVLGSLVPSSSGEVFSLLKEIREEERRNLELRVAQAEKTSPNDVTSHHTLSYGDLLDEKDAVLRRIALSNCRKYGRPLLQKWHPDREGGDPDVFGLCKTAIDSGDVELVQILLYRFGEHNAVKDFDPKRIAEKVRVRRTKYMGSRLYGVFGLFVRSSREHFLEELTKLLKLRLDHLRRMNIPGALDAQLKDTDEEEPDSI